MENLTKLYQAVQNFSIDKIKRAYFFFRFKYPKLILLVISIVAAYYLFKNPNVSGYIESLEALGYVGIFFVGMLFAFGFSAPFAIGFLITLQPSNMFPAALIGGFGALIADMLIFKFIKVSFISEFDRLKNEKPIKKTRKLISNNFGLKVSNYLLYFLAGILIASPLPDEVGVTMFAGLTSIKPKILGIISFILNTTGIYIILMLPLS